MNADERGWKGRRSALRLASDSICVHLRSSAVQSLAFTRNFAGANYHRQTFDPDNMEEVSANTYEQERRQKLQKLRDLGVDPFGQRTESIQPLAEVKAQHKPTLFRSGGPEVIIAGRVMLARRIGKLTFLKLRDETEDLQVAIDKKRVSDTDWQVHDLIDLGDQIVVRGKLGQTKTGEPTVWAASLTFAAKALLPPPGKFHGLEDVELRYRQRYVDLWANPDVMRIMKLRTRVIEEMRKYLGGLGYTEVETPMMQVLHGGANARPFETHHNALGIKLFMRIAPELYLKRLLVGGFRKVYEINRNFRNEGISPRHNPEFTMLEAYEAFGSFESMANLVEGMICSIAQSVEGIPVSYDRSDVTDEDIAKRAYEISLDDPNRRPEENWYMALRELTLKIVHNGGEGKPAKTINLRRPWRRVRMADLVEERTGWKFDKRPLQEAKPELIDRLVGKTGSGDVGVHHGQRAYAEKLMRYSPAEQLVEVYEKLIEPTLIDPTFVTNVPSVIIPLARENRTDPYFADVYELAMNGQEISPGYSELNDPDVQAKHFAHQVGDAEEQQKVDEDFLSALRYGMPPAGGMGMGVDRLVMMLTGAESIRDVILFPLMRPT